MSLTQTQHYRIGALLLSVLFLIIYLATLDTGLQPYELHGGDLITHQYAQVQARPGNAPGYPLYTMGGWLWFHGGRGLLHLLGADLPNPIPILSSYSTLWGLLALLLFYGVLGELIGTTRQPRLATAAALLITTFFGLTYFFWYYATTTEQYSSAVAQTLAIVYLYLKWDAQPERRDLVLWLALICGLSLAHMLTVAFIVPPLVAAMLWRAPHTLLRPRMFAGAVLAALLPLISYLYVYWRGALHPEWWGRGEWTTAQAWFWSFLSTPQGREELLWSFEPGRTFLGNGFPELIWQELSLPLLILGLVGLWLLPARHRLLFFGTLAIYLAFCWAYRFGNWFQVILPAYPLILCGLAPLYARLAHWGAVGPVRGRARALVPVLFHLLLVGLVGWRAVQSLPRADSRNRPEDTALDRASLLLAQPLPASAPLFAAVDDALALNYLTEIWGIRPDAGVVNRRDADRLLAAGRPVYSTFDATLALLDELDAQPFISSATVEWVELAPDSPSTTRLTTPVIATLATTPTVELVAVTAEAAPDSPTTHTAISALDVMLTWHLPQGNWPEGVAISVRPLAAGQPVVDPTTGAPIQQDRSRPVHGLWRPVAAPSQTLVADGYRLLLPVPSTSQVDGVLVIAYVQNADGSFTNLLEHRYIPEPTAPRTGQ